MSPSQLTHVTTPPALDATSSTFPRTFSLTYQCKAPSFSPREGCEFSDGSTSAYCGSSIAKWPSLAEMQSDIANFSPAFSFGTLRTFTLYRPDKPRDGEPGIRYLPPAMPTVEACVFSNGELTVRWLTGGPGGHCTAEWDGVRPFLACHGHPEYGTVIRWHDGLYETVGDQASYIGD